MQPKYEVAKNDYLCPYWLATGLYRATEDPAQRYDESINALQKKLVILKHPNDLPTTHFQKVLTDIKLTDITKQKVKRELEEYFGSSLEDDATRNLTDERLYSITEALNSSKTLIRRNSATMRKAKSRRKSILIEAIKHDFLESSAERNMRDRQLQTLVIKKLRSNYVEKNGKNQSHWREIPLSNFEDNLKALQITKKHKDRLAQYIDVDPYATTNSNSSRSYLNDMQNRKEILNMMNSHFSVKKLLRSYSRRKFLWPCFVYFVLMVFCVLSVPSFFWESDYAFEVNSLVISELRSSLKSLKDENEATFGTQIGLSRPAELGPWISNQLMQQHLPKLYTSNKLNRIGSIRICSLFGGGWKAKEQLKRNYSRIRDDENEHFVRQSYNDNDWAQSTYKSETISTKDIMHSCKKRAKPQSYAEYCVDINYDQDASNMVSYLDNCTWFKGNTLRTQIYTTYYSKQANLLTRIIQTFSKEPTEQMTSLFDVDSIKLDTWDIYAGAFGFANVVLEIAFCLYLLSELVGMIVAVVIAGVYSKMLLRQKYRIAGRNALLQTTEEEDAKRARNARTISGIFCCHALTCRLSEKWHNRYIRFRLFVNVLKSIVASPNQDYASLSVSQVVIVISGLLSVIFYVRLHFLKQILMHNLHRTANTGGVDDAMKVFEQAQYVRALMILLLLTIWFRLFDVLKDEPSLGPFVNTLFQTIFSGELLMFLLIFIFGLVPIILAIHLHLGPRVAHVSTIWKTLRTMIMFGIVGEHEQPDFWIHGTPPDNSFILILFFLVFIVLILLNLLIAIVTDVWQSFDREKIYLEAINDEIREAVSNHVEGIDYGKGSGLRDKMKLSFKLS